jgi:50S ribosomal subunit-associated GTPase HflX
LKIKYPNSVFISAEKGINLNSLHDKIFEMMDEEIETVEVKIPAGDDTYKIINKLHKQAEIIETKYLSKHVKLKIRGNKNELSRIMNGIARGKKTGKEIEADHVG